jgi:hypothetical protein
LTGARAASTVWSRTTLVGLWVVFLVWHLGALGYVWHKDYIEDDTFVACARQVATLYGPAFGTIGIFYFVRKRQSKRPRADALRLAVGSTLAWNLILFAISLAWLSHRLEIEPAFRVATELGNVFVWLISGAMTYAFAVEGA